MCPHTVSPTRPPGARTRRTSAIASGVVPQMPRKLVTTSKAPSSHGSACMSPTRRSASGLRSRATAMRRSDASIPAHRAPRRPASSMARPEPQATSSSPSPAPTPSRWCSVTYSRQLAGSLRVANSTALRPQPSSTPRQLRRGRVGDRRILRHGRDLGSAGPGITGNSDRPRSTRPSPCPQCKSSDRHREGELAGTGARSDSRARWPSIRASGAPRQWWMPCPKAR